MTTKTPKPQKTPVGYTVRGVVTKAGGPVALGAALDIHANSVRNWKTIPAKHAIVVAAMARLPLHVVRPELAEAPARPQKQRDA